MGVNCFLKKVQDKKEKLKKDCLVDLLLTKMLTWLKRLQIMNNAQNYLYLSGGRNNAQNIKCGLTTLNVV